MSEPLTLAELELLYPAKPWREPVRVKLGSLEAWRYACRVCVHNRGLHNDEIAALPEDPEAITKHIEIEHIQKETK